MTSKPVNKSELIRTIKDEDPDRKPKDIAAILKKIHKITVSTQYISTILSNRKRGNHSDSAKLLVADGLTAGDLLIAKQLVKQTGSHAAAIRAIKMLEQLTIQENQ